MSCFSHTLVSATVLSLAALFLTACGGVSDGNVGSSGSGGQAGSSGAGSGGKGGKTCQHEGSTYNEGDSFPAGDGCNSCSCHDGSVLCSLSPCTGQCFYDGSYYQQGESFAANDGCNKCSCSGAGLISCTNLACTNSCESISAAYMAAIDKAKACDPQRIGQCSKMIVAGLECGCDTFVNTENTDAIAQTLAAQEKYSELSCRGEVACGACNPPATSYCSPEGRCEDTWNTGAGASCKVNGVVYESGSSGIQDPASCNTCDCIDGRLSCTEADCPTACPPDRAYSTQCAQCGPTDDCEVVEHGCLPLCSDSCEDAACVDGVCRNLCG